MMINGRCIICQGYEETGICVNCGQAGLQVPGPVSPQPPDQSWFHCKAEIKNTEFGYVVDVLWTVDEVRLDRVSSGGTSTGGNRRLAERLAAAIDSQRAHVNMELRRDIYGQTYVQDSRLYMGKYLDSDLRELGF